MTAQWMMQLGWDTYVLEHPFEGQKLVTGGTGAAPPVLPDVMTITVAEAAHWLNDGAAAIFVGSSANYREAHPEDAVWAIRPRLDRLPASVLRATRIAVFAEDDAMGVLAAADLAEIAARPVVVVRAGSARGGRRRARLSPRPASRATTSASITYSGTTTARPATRRRCAPICAGKPNCRPRSPKTASPASASRRRSAVS